MKTSVIEVQQVSKKFCAYLKKSLLYGALDLFQEMFTGTRPQKVLRAGEFWALKDISFKLEKGEVLGILGKNGSGKSTLLRMINGIFPPDEGIITVHGKMGSLIALGAGFHPHMTGLENIFLNGAILGMNRLQIEQALPDIISFADIGDFLNAPVSTYSSGMTVRLGFSIAIHSVPEILIVDEVLAVGDINFQNKCYEKIYSLKQRGTSIILVSHAISTIERMCQRCLVLDKGKQVYLGSTSEAIREYTEICSRDLMEQSKNHPEVSLTYGAGNVEITDAVVYEAENPRQMGDIGFGRDFIIDFKYCFKKKESSNNELRLGIRTLEGRDIQLISFHEGHFAEGRVFERNRMIQIRPQGRFRVLVKGQRFFPQAFRVDISFSIMDRDYHEGGKNHAAQFRILQPPYALEYFEHGTMMVTQFETCCLDAST